MRRMISLLLVLPLLVSACALAGLQRGDSGADVATLQQMLWDTGFIFEEPDGIFGGNTEKAVKWFQEYANLEQSGVVDDRTLDSLYACWLQIMDENDINASLADNEAGSQAAGFMPDYDAEIGCGDYPLYCHRYTTDEGDEHVELCGRHAQLVVDSTEPALEIWANALNALYGEWLAASPEADRAAIASSQAFFTLWLEQQANALKLQNAENSNEYIQILLRNQCIELCQIVFKLTAE